MVQEWCKCAHPWFTLVGLGSTPSNLHYVLKICFAVYFGSGSLYFGGAVTVKGGGYDEIEIFLRL